MIRLMGEKHNLEKTKGWIGIQYAYTQEAKALISQMKHDDKFPQRDSLQQRFKKELEPYSEEILQKIQQVYKCKIPKPDELDYIKPIQTKITPIEPKNIRIPPPEAPYFANFHSEKIEGVRSSISLFVSNKKSHVEKSYYDLMEKKDRFSWIIMLSL